MEDLARQTLSALWQLGGLDVSQLDEVDITGQDPVLPGVFHVGVAAGVSIAAVGAAAAALWHERTGRRQRVKVDMLEAALMFRSERYLRIEGKPPPSPWGPLSGYYRTGDDRVVQIHANFPHHHAGILKLLECPALHERSPSEDSLRQERLAVKDALKHWRGQEFEDRASAADLCVGMLRERKEWQSHPQGQALTGLPLLEIEKVGDSPPEALPEGERPLSGIRALDLTRIIAGPVCGRTLAAHGADVLRVSAAHLPLIPHIWLDHARGKRSAHLDLNTLAGRNRLQELVRECDVFLQAYRPGAIAAKGFGVTDVAQLRPGVVYVTLSAYGHAGPWSGRRGFDSLVQTVSGIGQAGALAANREGTLPLPCQALDHATGYLAAFGAMIALRQRAREGGSWRVRVSLAQTHQWLWQMGQIDGLDYPEPDTGAVAAACEKYTSSEGIISAVKSAEKLSETPAFWNRPATPLGADEPIWLH